MAFGLVPQVVAQESTIVYADADTYEVVLDKPVALELNEANFKSLRDLGIDIQPETLSSIVGQPTETAEPNGTVSLGVSAPKASPQARPAMNMMDMPINALPSIANLVERVSPSVVNIIVTTETGETTSEGQGSGFIISDDLEVVTNYHVIEGGTNIDIEFNDGRSYPARILGTNSNRRENPACQFSSGRGFAHWRIGLSQSAIPLALVSRLRSV